MPDSSAPFQQLVDAGATADEGVAEVGEGIRVGTVRLPVSNSILGIIGNPHFRLVS